MNQINDPKFQKLTSQFFWESFFGIFIFGIPAFSALFLGKALDSRFGTEYLWKMILLASAFVLSWAVIFYRNRRLVNIYREYRAGQQVPTTESLKEHTKTE